jgi:hypothetical protein
MAVKYGPGSKPEDAMNKMSNRIIFYGARVFDGES